MKLKNKNKLKPITEPKREISSGTERFFVYKNNDYRVQTNNLQLTKINQNNMVKMSQTINITLQPMQ